MTITTVASFSWCMSGAKDWCGGFECSEELGSLFASSLERTLSEGFFLINSCLTAGCIYQFVCLCQNATQQSDVTQRDVLQAGINCSVLFEIWIPMMWGLLLRSVLPSSFLLTWCVYRARDVSLSFLSSLVCGYLVLWGCGKRTSVALGFQVGQMFSDCCWK